jgi:hypothetical protein
LSIYCTGRRKIKRRRSRESAKKCYFCDKTGHKSTDCTAKDTGKLLAKKKFASQLLTLPALSPEAIYTLRNKAPPIADTLRELQDYYENIDEYTDDEDWPEHPDNKENVVNNGNVVKNSKKRNISSLNDNVQIRETSDDEDCDDERRHQDVSTFSATSVNAPAAYENFVCYGDAQAKGILFAKYFS